MKKILLICTGGTIASIPSKNGLVPDITSKEILTYIPEAKSICDIDTIQLSNLDSTNISPNNWLDMVNCIKNNYEAYDGFVLTHGTDTMAYTASILSYLIQNSYKPIVLTGSQKSIATNDSDARNNLLQSLVYVTSENAKGVKIVFNGRVILGTRAKKVRSKSFDAFSSVNYPEVAVIQDRKVITYIQEEYHKPVKFYSQIDTSICMIKLIPTIHNIYSELAKNFDAVIIESFGLGGLPSYNDTYIKELNTLLESNVLVVITTQVSYEGSDMNIYKVGAEYKNKYNLIEAYDMTTESIAAKMMWIMGITKDKEEVRKLLYTPVYNDIIL